MGQEVRVGQVLCIIEAMKMMNQIESERAGKVVAVLAKNGEPVEFGQPRLALFRSGALGTAGARDVVLLRCTSAYPAPPDAMHLRTIPDLARSFGVPVGLSDHSFGCAAAVAAVALGAVLVEKHLTLSRSLPGPDSAFSLEPEEFGRMVAEVRTAERALGEVRYGPTPDEAPGRALRRSLFVVRDVRAGERFTAENVRAIRPADGLHTRHLEEVLGRRAARDACVILRG